MKTITRQQREIRRDALTVLNWADMSHITEYEHTKKTSLGVALYYYGEMEKDVAELVTSMIEDIA